ncbi:hypothetical protein ES702_06385 [subsurface metagenome]
MKEQACAKGSELYRAAIACGMDIEDAFNDVAGSIGMTIKAVPSFNVNDLQSSIQKWWSIFLTTYSLKCINRWSKQFGKSKDYQAMEELWFTSFEPLWIAGCNFARENQLQVLGRGLKKAVPRHSDKNSGDNEESLKEWADGFLAQLNDTIPEIITEFKGRQRKAMSRTLEELKEYDKASFFGKLKRWMSTR